MSVSIESRINDEICTLPHKISSYIHEITKCLEKLIGTENVRGVILFGSYARQKSAKISDVDLILIIDDSISNNRIKKIEPYLEAVEIKYNLNSKPDTLVRKILRVVEKTTGMFVSHFLVREKDWNKRDFPAIFRVNRLFSSILAPERIVLKSLRKDSIVLAGQNLNDLSDLKLRSYDLLRSYLMNTILSISALAISPFTNNAIKYSMESVKWSMRSCYFFLTERNPSIRSMCQFFRKIGDNNKFFDEFCAIRNVIRLSIPFRIIAPIQILRIHLLTLKIHKLKKN